MKLLMLISSLTGGGAEKVASELSYFLDRKIQRRILMLTNIKKYDCLDDIYTMNIKNTKLTFINIIRMIVVSVIKYNKSLNEFKPDVVMSFLVLDNIINIFANINNDVKKVICVHIAMTKKIGNNCIKRMLIKMIYSRANIIIAVSKGVKKDLITNFHIDSNKIVVIYNPIDLEKIYLLSNEHFYNKLCENNDYILINIGRLTIQKGQWYLIRIFSKVKKIIPNIKLIIRGSGLLKPYLFKLVKDLGLTNDVIFLDWVDNPYKYLSNSTIFISTSLWEALPMVLLEALACSLPIIATDCNYGPREILDDGEYGLLVPPMDGHIYNHLHPLTKEEEYLADMIVQLLIDKKKRRLLSKKSYLRAQIFDQKIIVKKYEKILKELIME